VTSLARTTVALGAALAASAAVALPPAPAPGGTLAGILGAVSAARFRAHVEFLADDLLEGREAGTRGFDLAARYAATEMEKCGLEPAGEDGTFFQAVPLVESRLVEGRILLEGKGRAEELEWRADFLMRGNPREDEARVRAPVVFAGYGVRAPALGRDDYAGRDVKGAVVAVLAGAPDGLKGEERAHLSSIAQKAREAARHGAVGLLLLQTPDSERVLPWRRLSRASVGKTTTWVRPDGTPETAAPELEGAAMLSLGGVEKLAALAGRGFERAVEAAEKRSRRPVDLGVTVTLEARSENRRFTSRNVIGRLSGRDPTLASTHVVYTAHLDHEGIGKPVGGDSIYNGAYDNAAGSAVVLEAARVLADAPSPPRRSILFLLVTAEEKGLLGSAYFAAHPTVPAESLVADVNVDMPLFLFPVAEVVAYGSETSTLGDAVRAAAAREGLAVAPDPVPEEHLFIRSDQYSFVQRGVPAVFLMTGTDSTEPTVDGLARWREFLEHEYHTPGDDVGEPMDLPSAARFIRFAVDLGWSVAESSERPRWRDDSFLGRTFGQRRTD